MSVTILVVSVLSLISLLFYGATKKDVFAAFWLVITVVLSVLGIVNHLV